MKNYTSSQIQSKLSYYQTFCDRTFAVALLAVTLIYWSTSHALSQTPSTADIVAQELQLKQKQLELEKAKLVQQQSESLDVQKAQLGVDIKKLELAKARRDLQVQETQDLLNMQLQGDVLFDTGQSIIKVGAAETLRQVALILSEFPQGKVMVTGFADSRGTEAENMKLSRDRAEAVKTYLLAKSGVSSERVIAHGLGEAAPAASNENATGRQLNRRVEISVSKLTS